MNALAKNSYTEVLGQLGKTLSLPKAVLCVSAHWVTDGFRINAEANPKTIHDFYGFPDALFQIQYPAPGSPQLAIEIEKRVPEIHNAIDWGFDHGMWSVLKHIYPKHNIPCLQLSLDRKFLPEQHFELGKKLKFLRNENVLILGSGNLVHNLRQFSMQTHHEAFNWAIEFDEMIKKYLEGKVTSNILNIDSTQTALFRMAHPSPEHFAPLYVLLGALEKTDNVSWIYEGIEHASISMRSILWS